MQDIEEAAEIGEVYKTDDEDEEEAMKVVKRYKKIITVPKKLEFILGKHGAHYKKYCAFSIQPQNYPNAIHYVSLYIYIFFGFLLKFFTKINI